MVPMIDPDNLEPIKLRPKAGLTYNTQENRFVISFDSDASRTEILQQLKRFEDARKKISGQSHFKKQRLPNDVQLLLGVRFFRSFGLSFPVIHEIYSKDQVPYYNEEYRFLTEFDLAKYYNRNIEKIKDI